MQAVVSVSGAPLTPEPAAERGFKIERNYYTLDGKPADPTHGQAEPAFRRGAEDDRAAAAVRPRHRRRLSAGRLRDRQSASGVVGRYRHARLDHRRRRAGAYRVPRRPFHRGVRSQRRIRRRCSRSPMWCGRCRPAITCCRRPTSRTCTGPTASAAPRPARSRSRRRNEALAPHPRRRRRRGR